MTDQSRKRLYGRSQGHKLSPRQQRLVETLGATLSWPDAGPLDPAGLLPGFSAHGLEIGFGAAEHLIGQARSAKLRPAIWESSRS